MTAVFCDQPEASGGPRPGLRVEHTVPVYVGPMGDRPHELFCTRCGLRFVKDPSWRQGYRPDRAADVRRRKDALRD